ncbi:MAG: NmrA family transcriptional regulator [Pseudonocardiales bacterium]|nr:MAG: NmrA family transcriptional regulator [Pseudonocardiales bacterium]
MTHTILVTGGTGTLGRAVVDTALAAGHQVRLLSRRRANSTELPYTWLTGDLRSGEGVAAAVTGADVIIHCATTNGRGDVQAGQTLLDAAQRAGTGHLIFISIVGVDAVPLGYYRAKLEVERRIADSDVPWTVLRATQFHNLVTRLFTVQRRLPILLIPRGISIQPIDVRDVAEHLVQLAGARPAARVPDIGGPQVRTATDLAQTYLHASRRRRHILSMPVAGIAARAYRAGVHLTPQHAVGTITYEKFLEDTP